MSPRPSGRSVVRIRVLNDLLRQFPFAPAVGQVFITAGVTALLARDQASVLLKVARFKDFTPDNDPHGEHDFGAFEHQGLRFFWRIDYYDLTMECLSPDPADPEITRRVLTVMRADEY
jgi:hypothetical protein